MISKYLSSIWATVAPALGNHLWQSTLVAIFAVFLAFALRKNHAAARYRLWLLASLKFLFPFSLLVGLGSYLTWSRGIARTAAGFDVALDEVSQPFTQATSILSLATPPLAFQILNNLLPVILTGVWLCGFMAVLGIWFLRWRKISVIVQQAQPMQEGREVNTLRKLERIHRIPNHMDIFLSRDSLEPGIFGIVRPVLVWPEGISGRLEDVHLEAIITHELCHVRRRDNLAAAIHMFIEALFWFHPLVWWLGARLVEERERACDEAVLESGGSRHIYAESILKICEFCIGSPLTCVSGVTGADLKKESRTSLAKGSPTTSISAGSSY
jgi:bla regulator protein blaR1